MMNLDVIGAGFAATVVELEAIRASQQREIQLPFEGGADFEHAKGIHDVRDRVVDRALVDCDEPGQRVTRFAAVQRKAEVLDAVAAVTEGVKPNKPLYGAAIVVFPNLVAFEVVFATHKATSAGSKERALTEVFPCTGRDVRAHVAVPATLRDKFEFKSHGAYVRVLSAGDHFCRIISDNVEL